MTIAATGASAREVLSSVRGWQRRHSRKGTADRLTDAYLGAFLVAYGIAIVAWMFDVDLSGAAFSFHDTFAWLPVVLFLAMWAVVRHGTWQGPVLFTKPEMQWLVSSPLDRRQLVAIRLTRAFTVAAVAGAVGGGIVTLIGATMTDIGLVGVFVGSVLSIASVALIAVSLAWHAERSPRVGTAVDRATALALVLGAVLALGVGLDREGLVLWSGPWGWASVPAIVASGGSIVAWPIMLGLLAVATVAAMWSAFTTTDRAPDEELWRRADARSAAAAAMFFGDIRTIRSLSKRERARGRVRGRNLDLRRPPRNWLVVASWDVLTMRRDPSRVVAAAVLTAGAFAAAVAAIDRPILAIVTFLGLYLAASRLVEPVRLEVEQPEAHQMLPWPWGTVIVLHAIVPVAVMAILGWTGLAVLAIGRFASLGDLWPFVVVAPFAAAGFVFPATVSAARQPFPVDSLVGGAESGPVYAILWLLLGPALAAIIVNFAAGMLRQSVDGNPMGVPMAIIMLTAASMGCIAWLNTRKPPTA